MHTFDDHGLARFDSLTDDLEFAVGVAKQNVAAGNLVGGINDIDIGSLAVVHHGRGENRRAHLGIALGQTAGDGGVGDKAVFRILKESPDPDGVGGVESLVVDDDDLAGLVVDGSVGQVELDDRLLLQIGFVAEEFEEVALADGKTHTDGIGGDNIAQFAGCRSDVVSGSVDGFAGLSIDLGVDFGVFEVSLGKHQSCLGGEELGFESVHVLFGVLFGVLRNCLVAEKCVVTAEVLLGVCQLRLDLLDLGARRVDSGAVTDIVESKEKPKEEPKKPVAEKKDKKATTNPKKGDHKTVGKGDGIGDGQGVPVTPPRPIRTIEPKYPASARNASIEGLVKIKMLITHEGKVTEASIVESSGHPEMDANALEAVYKWRFSPARNKLKQKIDCYITMPIKFKLRR